MQQGSCNQMHYDFFTEYYLALSTKVFFNLFLVSTILRIVGCCKLNPLTGGYYNEAEASYIKDMVSDLLQNYPGDLEQGDIVVVSSYIDQVTFSVYSFVVKFILEAIKE